MENNEKFTEQIHEAKTGWRHEAGYDFVIRNNKVIELTTTLTLSEYRNLIENACKLDMENKRLSDSIKRLESELAASKNEVQSLKNTIGQIMTKNKEAAEKLPF